MVIQKTVNNLKERPHEEKKVVAGGIAIAVVIILFIGWGFLFLRKIQEGSVPKGLEGSAVPADQFDLNLIRDTERQLNDYYNNTSEEIKSLRENAAQNQIGTQSQTGTQVSPNQTDQFGNTGGE